MGSSLAQDQRLSSRHQATTHRGEDSLLSLSPASVPEMPPFASPFWLRERVLSLLQVCLFVFLTTSVLREAGWLSASAVGHHHGGGLVRSRY